jgi:4-hydroxybenzoate polyprenyltransferase
MGLCRAGLYSLGALAVAPAMGASVTAAAVSVALYVVGLTHLARFENASRIDRLWPLAFLLAPFAVLALAPAGPHLTPGGAFVFLAALWVASLLYVGSAVRTALLGASTGSRRAVVSLIAALSLLDACFALRHGHTTLALVAVASFALTRRLQRRIPGT